MGVDWLASSALIRGCVGARDRRVEGTVLASAALIRDWAPSESVGNKGNVVGGWEAPGGQVLPVLVSGSVTGCKVSAWRLM